MNNSVFQVLVTKNNQAILAAGNRVASLLPNQIGFFDYDTGLSIDAAAAATTKNMFVAVGVDKNGDGTMDDIVTSAGTHIQKKNLKAYNLKCYSDARNQIIDITNYNNIKCETDYAVKIEFRGLSQVYQNFGFNQFIKTYTVTTPCCSPSCTDCGEGDCNVLTQLLVDEINNDPDALVTAEYLDYTTTPGSPVVVAPGDVATWIANVDNNGKCLGVRITGSTQTIEDYCSINLKYYKLRTASMYVSFAGSLPCEGTATVVQTPAYQEGSGYDVQQLEYQAAGWNGTAGAGTYRVGNLIGMNFGGNPAYSDKTGKYLQINLHYDQDSVAGWGEYKNNLHTVIAIPCADATTAAAVIALLDGFVAGAGFEALTNDYAICNTCTGTKLTTTINNYTTDGIS